MCTYRSTPSVSKLSSRSTCQSVHIIVVLLQQYSVVSSSSHQYQQGELLYQKFTSMGVFGSLFPQLYTLRCRSAAVRLHKYELLCRRWAGCCCYLATVGTVAAAASSSEHTQWLRFWSVNQEQGEEGHEQVWSLYLTCHSDKLEQYNIQFSDVLVCTKAFLCSRRYLKIITHASLQCQFMKPLDKCHVSFIYFIRLLSRIFFSHVSKSIFSRKLSYNILIGLISFSMLSFLIKIFNLYR